MAAAKAASNSLGNCTSKSFSSSISAAPSGLGASPSLPESSPSLDLRKRLRDCSPCAEAPEEGSITPENVSSAGSRAMNVGRSNPDVVEMEEEIRSFGERCCQHSFAEPTHVLRNNSNHSPSTRPPYKTHGCFYKLCTAGRGFLLKK
jgi:hypothetical protein